MTWVLVGPREHRIEFTTKANIYLGRQATRSGKMNMFPQSLVTMVNASGDKSGEAWGLACRPEENPPITSTPDTEARRC